MDKALLHALLHTAKAPFQRRGFGVHSPLAYRLITEVLTPRNISYYAEDEILQRSPFASTTQENQFAALLLRVGMHFPITRIEIQSHSTVLEKVSNQLALQCPIEPMAHLHGCFSPEEHYLLKASFTTSKAETKALLDTPLPAYSLLLLGGAGSTLQLCRSIRDQHGYGITFYLRSATFLLLRPRLHPADYYATLA